MIWNRPFSFLLLLIFVLIELQAKAETCISQVDYDKASSKIQQLETDLASAKKSMAASQHLTQQVEEMTTTLEKMTSERNVCDTASKALFERVKELEEKASNLSNDMNSKTAQITTCKNELQQLSHSSTALSSCQTKMESTEQLVDQYKKQLETVKEEVEATRRKLKTQEESFQSDIQNLKVVMKSTEEKYLEEKKKTEQSVVECRKELSKATIRLEKVAQDSYLFSFAQFKRTMAKVAAFNKALIIFIGGKVEPMLPPTLMDDIRSHVAEGKIVVVGLYRTHLKSHVETMTTITSPHIITLRKLYSEHAAEPVDQARQAFVRLAIIAWNEGRLQFDEYSKVTGRWVETNVVQPFIASHPAIKELIPESNVDRLFATMYLIAVVFLNACLVRFTFRWFIRPALKSVKCTLFMPWRLLRCIFCCKTKKSDQSRKILKKETVVKREAVYKKDASPKDKKDASGKRVPKRA